MHQTLHSQNKIFFPSCTIYHFGTVKQLLIFLENCSYPCRNRQTWPRPVMKHTARSGPSLARPVPFTARLFPEQPDLAPVGPCISSLFLDSWRGPGQGHSKISAWVMTFLYWLQVINLIAIYFFQVFLIYANSWENNLSDFSSLMLLKINGAHQDCFITAATVR